MGGGGHPAKPPPGVGGTLARELDSGPQIPLSGIERRPGATAAGRFSGPQGHTNERHERHTMTDLDTLGIDDDSIASLLDGTGFEILPSAPRPAKTRPRRGRKTAFNALGLKLQMTSADSDT
jgi:hypothetical protein